jgi:hypothetical protein
MIMTRTALSVSLVALLSALAIPGLAQAQGSAANVAGTYRCVPEPTRCQTPTYTVTQNGQMLELKGEDGTLTGGKMTSNITLSAGPILNANGVILPDRSIQWSNGTHWQKQ